MEIKTFVQNVKHFCEVKGVKPTVACDESGVGTSFLTDVKRGRTPSVTKVQMLAEYLGVTTSDLLGEEKCAPIDDGSAHAQLLNLVSGYSEEEAARAAAILRAAFGRQVE